MPKIDVAETLERAKKAHGLKTDLELAGYMSVPRETILSWKKRGSIPAKYLPTLAGKNLSLDWLLTGNGEKRTVKNLGFDKKDEFNLDDECLWICLNLMIRDMNNNGISNIGFEKKEIVDIYVFIFREYPNIMRSKKKWIESGIIKKKDIYKALLVEYDLGDWEYYSPPWWEDEGFI